MELEYDLNLYKTFYIVAKFKSFSEASKKLYVSQPTISNSIKKLEDQLDTKLFYRRTDGVSLTADGKEILSYIEKSYNLLMSGTRNLQSAKEFVKGKVSIGVRSHIGEFFLFDYIKKFHQKYPNIDISIVSRNTEQMIELLENNEIDFIIDTSPINSIYSNLKINELYELENCFVSKEKIPEEISFRDLNNYNIILPLDTSTPGRELDKTVSKYDIKLNPFMTIDTTEMLISAVQKNLGIGYVIKQFVQKEINNNNLFEVRIKEKLPKLMLNLVYIEDYLTYIPRAFMDMIINDYNR